MKDIILNRWWKWFIFIIGWIFVVISPIWWIVVGVIYMMFNYGDKPKRDKNNKKVLYRKFEKLIYVLGWIGLIFAIIFNISGML